MCWEIGNQFFWELAEKEIRTPTYLPSIPSAKLYPNPGSESIQIDLPETASIRTLQVWNQIGQLQQVSSAYNNRIVISHLPIGIYYVQLRTEDDQVYLGRFVKE